MTKRAKAVPQDDFPSGVSNPARRALASIGVHRLADLTTHREADLAQLHGMGPKALGAIRVALAERKLGFKE